MTPDFSIRSGVAEWMDDFSIDDERLRRSLEQLRKVNYWLGGYRTVLSALTPFLLASSRLGNPVRLIDVGAGICDMAESIVDFARRRCPGLALEIVGVDANPATVAYARASLKRRLTSSCAIYVEQADALSLPYADGAFDIAIASLLLHHFPDESAVRVLSQMRRVSRHGIIVSDLHRHPVAYYGFATAAAIFGATPMVRRDGPLSVLRAFSRRDLTSLAHRAGIPTTGPHWRWAFRWLLSTVEAPVDAVSRR
jgi:SAM-dependent methyltransferase